MNRKNIHSLAYKIFISISFLFIFSVLSAQERDRKVTIQEKDITLKEVFSRIEKQTGYTIAYEQSKLDLKKKISVSLNNINLNKALSEVLKNTGFTYKITGYHIILVPIGKEQHKQAGKPNTEKITQNLSGVLVEKGTDNPVQYATVSLVKEPSRGAMTDSLGHFNIAGIPAGPCDVKVTVLGYKPIFINDIMNIPGSEVILDISLNTKSHYLNEVVVTEKNKPEDLVQSTQMGALSLSKTAIKNVPVILGEADVIKALQTQPGVVGGIEGLAGMYVRGGNGDENLYMLDGNPLYQINHFGGLFSAFNTEIIRNVDFYKSSFPARYGGRLSSVVNVQTIDGNMKEFHGTAMLGLISGGIHVQGPIIKEKTSFSASLRRSWLEAVSVPALAIINHSESNKGDKTIARYSFTDLNLKLKHLFSKRSHAHVNLYWGQDYLKFGKEEYDWNEEEPFKSGDIGRLRWGNLLLSAGWTYLFNEKLSANLNASYTHYASNLERSVYETFGNETRESENSLIENNTENGINDYNMKADFNYAPVSAHNIHFGAIMTHHRFRPEFTRSYSNTGNGQSASGRSKQTLSANEINMYIEDDWKISSFLSLNAGLRMGYFKIRDESYWSLEPRVSTRFLLTSAWSMKASYSKMNQNMQQVSESYISLPTDYWVPVIENQKPLVSDQVSMGTYYNLNNDYSFSLEGYYKWMDNLLDYKEGYNFLPSTTGWQNKLASGKGWSYGADFIVRKETGRITGYIGYGLMWANRKFDEINDGRTYPSKYDNRHKINIVANWKLSNNVELNAGWTYMTGNRVTISLENYQNLDIAGFPPGLAPTDPYFSEDYPGVNYYDKKNNVRMPAYHRLDLGINIYRPKKNGHMGIWNVSIYNVYSRMNPIAITKESLYRDYYPVPASERKWNNKFKTLSLFPIIPSLSYTYKF